MALDHEELTGQIIGAAIEVHKQLGPGFIESIYENALAVEFQYRGIPFSTPGRCTCVLSRRRGRVTQARPPVCG